MGGSALVHGMAVVALVLNPSSPAAVRSPGPSWVTFGDVELAAPALEIRAMEWRHPALDRMPPPALLPPLEAPLPINGDVRVSVEEVVTVDMTAPHPASCAAPGVTASSYWMRVRAALQAGVGWPAGLRSSTSVVLRLQASPYGCVVLEPPPGPGAADAVRAAARRASDLVARADDEDVPAQAELAIRFESNPRTRR